MRVRGVGLAGGWMWFTVAILAAAAGCTHATPHIAELPPPEVTISRPAVLDVTDYYEFTGNTVAVEKVDLRSRVSGYLRSVNFQDGQRVKRGDVLFQIDPDDYRNALDKAIAEADRQEAAVKKAVADLARTEELFKQRVRTKEEFDQDTATLAMAKAQLAGTKAALEQAKLDLDYTKITAPIDGRTSKANVTAGNLIQAGNGDVLTTIVRMEPIYVEFNVDENALQRFQELARTMEKSSNVEHIKDLKVPVFISLSDGDGFQRRGMLDFGDNRVDPNTGTILLRAVFENQDLDLQPGRFVRVRVPYGGPHKAVLISDRAIVSDQDNKFVLVVPRSGEQQDVAQYNPIQLGGVHDGLREVQSGLSADQWLITNGLQRVRPGIKVAPREGPLPGAAAPAAAVKNAVPVKN